MGGVVFLSVCRFLRDAENDSQNICNSIDSEGFFFFFLTISDALLL